LLLANNCLSSLSNSPDQQQQQQLTPVNSNSADVTNGTVGFIGDINSLISTVTAHSHDNSLLSPANNNNGTGNNNTGNMYGQTSLGIGNGGNAFALHHMMMMINQLKSAAASLSESTMDSNCGLNGGSVGGSNLIETAVFLQSNNLSNLKCYQHPNELCQNYCNCCQKTLCAECSASAQHRQHPKTSLADAVNDAKLSIESLLAESTQIVDVFKDSLKQSMQMIARIQAKTDFVSNEINKTHVQHLKALDQRKKLLIENLEIIQSTKVFYLFFKFKNTARFFANK